MNTLIQGLLEARAYAHPVQELRLIETHISWVILSGSFAYKIKKPLNLEFLDFSTLEKRRYFCEEELRINRRFAPALYLEVVAITQTPEGPRMAGEGEPIEYAVRMRQFAPGSVLTEVLEQRPLAATIWRNLGSDLAKMHAGLPASDHDDTEHVGTPGAVRDAVSQNFRQCRAYLLRERSDLEEINALEEMAWRAYRQLEPYLWRRYEAGRVRECHGDLHLGNIALIEERALPFDALEFNVAFRWNDVMSELAFLVMDCEKRGQGEAGFIVLNAWLEHSGDYAGLRLLRFFTAYRAMVRAKVSLLSGQPPVEPGSAAHLDYRRYVALARSCQQPAPVFLAITCGVSGSGKSTLAEALAGRLRAIRIRSDVERKRLYGLAPEQSSRGGALEKILYAPEAGQKTFARLEQLAAGIIGDGYPVIVDATFIRAGLRARFRTLARELGVPFHILFCDQSLAELRRRVVLREQQGTDASEAGLTVLKAQLAEAEFPDSEREPETLRVTDREEATITRLAQLLQPLP